MRVRLFSAATLFVVAALAGCGGKDAGSPAAGTGTPTNKEALDDLVRLLQDFEQKQQKPPAKMAAVEAVEPVFPAAYLGLSKGDVVYVWGVGLSSSSANVLAHEKKAPTEGGWVLLQSGEVKEMTAEQFKAAPKAK